MERGAKRSVSREEAATTIRRRTEGRESRGPRRNSLGFPFYLYNNAQFCYYMPMENISPQIIIGNCEAEKDNHRGWIIGHFMDKGSLLHSDDLEVKWSKHLKGEKKLELAKNIQAKTLFILFNGEFRFYFPNENTDVVLSKEGDYILYDAGVAHSWEVLEDCCAINIRWPSIAGDQQTV